MSVSNFFTHLQTKEVNPVALFLSFEVAILLLFFLAAGGCVVFWRGQDVASDAATITGDDNDESVVPYIL